MSNRSVYVHGILTITDHEGNLLAELAVEDTIPAKRLQKRPAAIGRRYFEVGVWSAFFMRIPWLLILMAGATLAGMVITVFESALATSIALTAFIPMLMGTGGNSGSQSSVTVIRALALGDIRRGDIRRVLWKELRVASLCAVTLAGASWIKLWLVDRLWLGTAITPQEMLIACITLAITVVFAKLLGCTLPLLAKRLGLDPAVMASPFITTLVDVLSLSLLFGIATLVL